MFRVLGFKVKVLPGPFTTLVFECILNVDPYQQNLEVSRLRVRSCAFGAAGFKVLHKEVGCSKAASLATVTGCSAMLG